MRFTTRKLLTVTAALVMCCALATLAWSWVTRKGVEFHQRAITREITEWGNEYAQITDEASAIRAAGMLEYIDTYYKPGDSYRGFNETERELESARAKSLRQLVEALEAYTGLGFGDDYTAWSQWADYQKQPRGDCRGRDTCGKGVKQRKDTTCNGQ